MAEELNRYKWILEREDKESREVIEAEVSTSWSSEYNRKKVELQQGTFYHSFYSEFYNFFE